MYLGIGKLLQLNEEVVQFRDEDGRTLLSVLQYGGNVRIPDSIKALENKRKDSDGSDNNSKLDELVVKKLCMKEKVKY